ncbi:MAG: HlyD family efflux transporter periplasmic adaptor subunit [Firmicutes bacterium]|nr:HlyD family efflux transporter periplasmic adaptor subunit [Candidatus Fermentithermobacillaceae bacterium]
MIVLVLAFFLLPWPVIRSAVLKAAIPLGFPREGALDIDVTGRCLLAGSEVVVKASADGVLRYLVRSGEWVRAGTPICTIRSEETREVLEEALRARKEELRAFDRENSNRIEEARKDLLDAYREAGRDLLAASRASALPDLAMRKDRETRVLSTCARIAELRNFLESSEEKRSAILREIAYLEQALSWAEVTVLAPVAGVFFRQVDGLEARYYDARELSAADIRASLDEALRTRPQGPSDGDRVSRGQILGKIVPEETVRFFLPVPTEDRPPIEQGQAVTVRTTSAAFPARIERVIDGKPPGYSVIVGSFELGLSGTETFPRYLDITLVTFSAKGLIVPSSALVQKNGTTGVLVVQKAVARFCPVEVMLVKGNEAVLRGISPETQIVLRGWAFLEGKRVR